jgi:hypothetical protein
MALTGRADGPPLAPPPGLVRRLDGLAAGIGAAASALGADVALRWEPVCTGRAAVLGLRRAGRASCNGSARLLRAGDGWLVVNLARPDDQAAVDAIVGAARIGGSPGGAADGSPWDTLAAAATTTSAADLVATARLLGVPAAVVPVGPVTTIAACTMRELWPRAGRGVAGATVVDLSAMWAGPLAAAVLARAGATVTKVEHVLRPDGARAVPAFYDSLHAAGQPSIRLDFTTEAGRRALRALLADADVVIESSRPRALEQLGAGPSDVAARAGRVWVSVTGYGRAEPGREWVAFGDDAAVAGGLVAWEGADEPVFCADAIADPIGGMVAAEAALRALADGGGVLLDVALAGCAASCLDQGEATVPARAARPAPGGGWEIDVAGEAVPVLPPAAAAW